MQAARLFAAALLVGAATLPAQSGPTPPQSAVQGAFFAISVADLEASTAWYKAKFGMTEAGRIPKQGKIAVVLLTSPTLDVELLQHDDATSPANANDRVLVRGLTKVGFRVSDFDKTLATLRARGAEVAYGPYPARKDQRANAIIRDNSGNLIQLFGSFAP